MICPRATSVKEPEFKPRHDPKPHGLNHWTVPLSSKRTANVLIKTWLCIDSCFKRGKRQEDLEHRFKFSSVQFSSVVSDSLRPHGLQHARPPCPSPVPGACSNSCSLSQWCHPTISSSVIPFSSSLNPSQHQGLFKCVSSSHQVAKLLEFQLQHQSFQWTPRNDLL